MLSKQILAQIAQARNQSCIVMQRCYPGLCIMILGYCKRNPNGKKNTVCVMKQETFHGGVPDGSDGKESTSSVGLLDLIPGLGRSPEEGNSNTL